MRKLDQVSFPAAYHHVTYLNLENAQDKVGERSIRKTPEMATYRRYIVCPYDPKLNWKRDMDPPQGQTIYGELNRAADDVQPEYKDSTERMRDMAEDPLDSDRMIDNQHIYGFSTSISH